MHWTDRLCTDDKVKEKNMKSKTFADLVTEYDRAINRFCDDIKIEAETNAGYTIKNMGVREIFSVDDSHPKEWNDQACKQAIVENYYAILERIGMIASKQIQLAKESVEPLVGKVIIKDGALKLIEINAPGEDSIHIITNNGISKHIVTDGFKEALLLFAGAI